MRTLIKSGNTLELCVGSRTFSDFREKLTLKNAAVPPNVLMSRSQLKCHNDYCQFTENNLHFLLHFRSNFHRRSPLQVEGTARKCFQCFAATGSRRRTTSHSSLPPFTSPRTVCGIIREFSAGKEKITNFSENSAELCYLKSGITTKFYDMI